MQFILSEVITHTGMTSIPDSPNQPIPHEKHYGSIGCFP